jgi:hypothetical protein
MRKVERQVKALINNLAIFFLFPSKEFLPISFKIQLLKTSGIKIYKGDEILRPIFKKPFSEILSGCFHFRHFSS